MPNNVQAEAVVSAGVRFVSAEVTAYGDANSHVPGCFLGIVSGSEGSQTFTEYVGGAGAVTAGTQRVTLGSDDPAVASLAVLDDWDESDRAKVNLIVGQAGIAAGAGAVGATVPRVTLASDDPGVALLTTIDADTGNIVTAVQLLDDAVYTDGTGTPSKGIAVMGTDGTNPQLVSVNTSGHVNIADGGNAITVDGTVAATQSGTWTVTGTGGTFPVTDSGGSLTVDNAGTFAVQAAQSGTWNVTNISGTVSLPTGASTLAEQQTQTTALQLLDDVVYVDDADWTDSTSRHALVGGLYQSTPQTVTDGDVAPFNITANGALHVAVQNSVTVDLGANNDVTVTSGSITANAGTNLNTSALALESGGNLAAAATSLALLDNAISGNEMQVDVVGALPAGTNNIGDVDVLSVVPGTAATNLGKAIDSASGGTDTGVAVLAIRDDSLSTLTPVEGDYVPLRVSSTGALHVTGGGGGTQYNVDDVAGATDTGTLLLAIRDDSLATLTPADGDYVGLRVSSTGALHVTGGGGGTEYNEDAATPATITGTATMMERDDALSALTPVEGDWAAMRCDANGALWVAVNSSALPSGAATAANQSTANGLLTTIDADTGALAGCVSGTELQVDIVSSATLTVNAHAVTNAGTFAVQVDGNALTALQLIDNIVHVDDAAFTLGTHSGVMMMGFAGTQSVDANDAAALACTTAGALHISDAGGSLTVDNGGTFAVQIDAGAVTSLALIDDVVFADDAAFTLGTSKGVMMMGFAGTQSVDANDAAALACTTAGALRVNVENTLTVNSHAVTNAGTFAVQVDGAALTALQLIDDCIFTDDAAFTPGTSKLAVIGAQADETSTDSVDEGDAGALRMTLDRKLLVVAQPHTNGGCSIFRTLDLDETEEDVKTAAGQIYGIFAINTTNATLYLKVYNATAANVTVGTTTPVMTLPVPGNNDTDGAGFVLPLPFGVAFDTAISVAATTGVADNDTGAPGANALIVQVFYK